MSDVQFIISCPPTLTQPQNIEHRQNDFCKQNHAFILHPNDIILNKSIVSKQAVLCAQRTIENYSYTNTDELLNRLENPKANERLLMIVLLG